MHTRDEKEKFENLRQLVKDVLSIAKKRNITFIEIAGINQFHRSTAAFHISLNEIKKSIQVTVPREYIFPLQKYLYLYATKNNVSIIVNVTDLSATRGVKCTPNRRIRNSIISAKAGNRKTAHLDLKQKRKKGFKAHPKNNPLLNKSKVQSKNHPSCKTGGNGTGGRHGKRV